MSTNEGNAGVGARYYGDELATLKGVLASERGAVSEETVYPDDYCLECVRQGLDDGRCFHNHWETTDQVVAPYERRGKLN